jgi:hypothetical protein
VQTSDRELSDRHCLRDRQRPADPQDEGSRNRCGPKTPNILYNAACTYGILGQKLDALALLRRARDAGYSNLEWALRDPDLACLRDDPEFQRLVGKAA